jgi:hypothetical protein
MRFRGGGRSPNVFGEQYSWWVLGGGRKQLPIAA